MVYILAFIGMILWGVSPLFAKVGLKDINPLVGLCIRTLFSAFVILICMFFNGSIVQLKGIPFRTTVLLFIEAVLATVIGDLAYFAALKRGSPSIVMLIMACSPLITVLFSFIIFHEKLTLTNILGAFLIILGVYLVM